MLARNHFVFNHEKGKHWYVTQLIWQGLIDYARAAWTKALAMITKQPERKAKLVKKFDIQWGRFHSICHRSELLVTWVREVPDTGIT